MQYSSRQVAALSTVRPGWESLDYELYDYQSYAAAGQTQLSFFTTPVGGTKTLSDTNMQLAGQIPSNQEFIIQRIEVPFFPTVPAVTAANPSAQGAQAVAAQVNDTYIVRRTGNLLLTIGTKTYVQSGPMSRFPASSHFEVTGAVADTSTAGASLQHRSLMAHQAGKMWVLKTQLPLMPNQNFAVQISWPEGVQAIANAGRIGVVLAGVLRRRN